MYKKIATVFLIIAMAFVMLAGCAGEPSAAVETKAAQPSAVQTPTPQPPTGIKAAFGREISITAVSNADEAASALFFDGVQKEAQDLGVTIKTVAAKDRFDTAVSDALTDGGDAIIACFIGKANGYTSLQSAVDKGLSASMFEMQKGDVPDGVSHLYYTPDAEVDMAFDAALYYPPHEMPVRLILMFESKDTKSYAAYQKLHDEGKILPKEIYIASEDANNSPGDWLSGKLKGYVEGMLDGVFAENSDLANKTFDALENLNRTDVELFSIGITSDTITRMGKNPGVFAQATGANTVLAGVLNLRASLIMLHGGDSVTLELKPGLINAADLGSSPIEALSSIDPQKDLFNEAWMDTLRGYYKK